MKSVIQCIIYSVFIWSFIPSIANTPRPFSNNIKEYLTAYPDTVPAAEKIRLPKEKVDPVRLKDPASVEKSVIYDPVTNRYILTEKIGDDIISSTPMTFEEYSKYKNKELQEKYFSQLSGNSDGSRGTGKDPVDKIDVKQSLIDRLFGGNTVDIKPSGFVEISPTVTYQEVRNPSFTLRQQKQIQPDFPMNIQMNMQGKVGEKLNLDMKYNTQSTFDFDNAMKLNYNSDKFSEDEILKKIDAGNVSLPLRTSLIQGAQNLFGVKVETQFGKLRLTGIASQTRTQQQKLELKGGEQIQEFEIQCDEYEDNQHYLFGHYFRNIFERSLSRLPYINTLAKIDLNSVQVWVSPSPRDINNLRQVVAIADLGEYDRMNNVNPGMWLGGNPIIDPQFNEKLPTNQTNTIYTQLLADPKLRLANQVVAGLQRQPFFFNIGQDFEVFKGELLDPREYTVHPDLGYISFRRVIRPNDIVAISYKYTFNGKPYKVGEFTQEVAPDSLGVIVTKLLKPRSNRVDLPMWDLMMKNFYSLRSTGISEEDFKLDILFDDPGKGVKRFLSETELKSIPLLNLNNLDRLNKLRDPSPDGTFDFVPGLTIDPSQGRIMIPLLEPFGESLGKRISDPDLRKKYAFTQLYDSTKAASLNYPQANRYIIRGEYKGAGGGNGVSLNSFNIPENSVRVTVGGQQLRNDQYELDAQSGQVRITDQAILQSGQKVEISYEDQSLFGFNTNRTMFGLRGEYQFNRNLSLGGTMMRLFERPYTQKTNIGEDPINNGIYGLDLVYNNKAPWMTKLLDKLPLFSTKEESKISFIGEGALLRPGHSRAINQGKDKGGVAYIDDFEGTTSNQDLGSQYLQWHFSSIPMHPKFREARPDSVISTQTSINRARMAWYRIDNQIEGGRGSNNYEVAIPLKEIFPARTIAPGTNNELYTFNIHFDPTRRGPYNFDVPGGTRYSAGMNKDNGKLENPKSRWAGIQRGLYNTDFEASNIETVEFFLLNPFMSKSDGSPITSGGNIYINLGDVSEDILRDGQMTFENGLPTTQNKTKYDSTAWGRVPLVQVITRSHNNNPEILKQQDLGYDGLDNKGEVLHYSSYLSRLQSSLSNPLIFDSIRQDPANDDYKFFNDDVYPNGSTVTERYSKFNLPQGNTSFTEQSGTTIRNYTQYPESEDLNDDNAFDQADNYYEYKVPINPDGLGGMALNKYITDTIKGQNGRIWYRVKIPIATPDSTVGSIRGFRNIRFMRIYVTDFDQSVTFRMSSVDLVRNQWRRYNLPLCVGDKVDRDFKADVNDVNIEENSKRIPIGYVVPAGIQRENTVGAYQNLLQNEQALALSVKKLDGGCATAVYKTIRMDMRQYERMRMFVHADSPEKLPKEDLVTFIRIGSDFTNNYYEYQIPTLLSEPAKVLFDKPSAEIWKIENEMDLNLVTLVDLKKERNAAGAPLDIEYAKADPEHPDRKMIILGNPTLGKVKQVMLGVRFPKRDNLEHDVDVWFNELRLNGINEQSGYGGTARLDMQLADLGDLSINTNYNSIGWGALDQRVLQRAQEDLRQIDINSNLELGKFLPKKWGIKIPMYSQLSVLANAPKYDPYDLDIKLKDKLLEARNANERDSIRNQAQDYESVRSVTFTNVGKDRAGDSKPMPWDISNFKFNYSHAKVSNHDPLIEKDEEDIYKGGFNYAYTRESKFISPFKKLLKNDKHIKFISQFNFNPLPNSFSFTTGLDRRYNVRNFRFSTPEFGQSITKLFYWDRKYNVNWDFSQSLKFSFTAANNSAIDELPVMDSIGRLLTNYDPVANKQLIWDNIGKLGRAKNYSHSYNANYTLPTRVMPIFDWVQLTAGVNGTYGWVAGSQNVVDFLQNVMQNSQARTLNANLNFEGLYDKWSYLRKINDGPAPKNNDTNSGRPSGRPARRNADGSTPPATNTPEDAKKKKEKQKKEHQPGWMERVLVRPLMSLRKGQITYSENLAAIVPGFKGVPKYLGMASGFADPGWSFITGFEPSRSYLDELAQNNMITSDIRLNQQVSKNYSQNFSARLTIEPFRDFNIELSLDKNYTNNYLEFFKNDGTGAGFKHLSPTEIGTFDVSYLGIKTLFKTNPDTLYNEFERNREVFSHRLPNKPNATNHPLYPEYTEGLGKKNQNVIIPAFIATYAGIDPTTSKTDVFRTIPKPNWELNYNGLHKLPFLKKVLSAGSIKHSYKSRMTINQYNTDIFFNPDSLYRQKAITKDYYSRIEIPSVVISEAFRPLIGVDIKTTGDLQLNFDYSLERGLSLTMIDYQLIEQNSKEFTLGFGWRVKNVVMPFGKKTNTRSSKQATTPDANSDATDARGRKKNAVKKGNDLNIKFDFSYRDDFTDQHVLDQGQKVTTRGAETLRTDTSAEYELNDRVTLKAFFNYNRTIPAVSDAFPITSARGGVTIRLALK